MTDIISLVQDIQVTDNQLSWEKLFNRIKPLINSCLINTPPQYRDDLKQELYIVAINAVRNFKIKK